MRLFKLTGALIVVLAFSAISVATASAVETLWKWLPGSVGETFKGSSEVAKLLALVEKGAKTVSITCKKSSILLTDAELKISSELLKEGSTEGKDATLALIIIHFEGCEVSGTGLLVKSTGDNAGIILVHIEAHNCMITKGDFGVLLKPLPLVIEQMALGLKINVRGDALGLLEGKEKEKLLTFKLNLKSAGVETNKFKQQEFLKCEGGEVEKLEASLDGITFEPAAEEVTGGKLEFDMTKDKEGEEMMEK